MRKRKAPPADHGLWKGGSFLIACWYGPEDRLGHTYSGLGMHVVISGSPKGRRPPTWIVTHLGTGHGVCLIKAHMAEAFELATELAELRSWDFDSLDGWKDRDPDLMSKVEVWGARHSKKVCVGGGIGQHEEVAREIAIARA